MRQLWLPTTLNQPIADPVINRFDAIISALMGFAPKNGYVRPRGGGVYDIINHRNIAIFLERSCSFSIFL